MEDMRTWGQTVSIIGRLKPGLTVAQAQAEAIASLLFGTAPTDPATFLGVVLVLAAVALVAGYVPARRASRIHPMIALRSS
jgi:ABC-type antimicrobial peptide transport system permease subunit